jgi:hypothetical protein
MLSMLLLYSLLLGLCLIFICLSGTTCHNFSQYSFLCDIQFDPKYVNLLGWVFLDDTTLTTTCSWSGEKCDDNNQIISLQLSSVGLSGSIPNAIMKLTALTSLSIDSNFLTGSIPESVGNMTSLRFLNASNNRLAGSIALTISKLTGLERLYLFFNSLTDLVPTWNSEMDDINFISVFDVHENQLSGTISDGIGNWINLNILDLPRNAISEFIPFKFERFRNLKVLDLSYNYLEGSIDNLNSISSLMLIQLRNNILDGSIPFLIGSFVDLVSLDLRDNRFVGGIPESFIISRSLKNLLLTNNGLSHEYCPRLCDLGLNSFLLTSSTVEEGNLGVLAQQSISHVSMSPNLVTDSDVRPDITVADMPPCSFGYLIKGYFCSRMAVILLLLNHSAPDVRNLHEFRRGSIFVFFYFPSFTNDEKDVTNIQYNISNVGACYTTANCLSHSSLYVSVYVFMWWLTLLGVTTPKMPSRIFTILAIKQRHMNAVFRYVMFCMIIICTYKIPVGVNGAFSRSSKLLAKDGAAYDIFGHVSIYDTTAMIGAHGDDDKAGDAGILVIYSHKLQQFI